MIPPEEAASWSCDKCGQPLKLTKVEFAYMKGNFEADIPACPNCGMVLVTEDLALGKMAEVERILEDK